MILKIRRLISLFSMVAPLLFIASIAVSENTIIPTPDGTKLVAHYQLPLGKNPVVVMLHGLASSKSEWKPLCDALSAQGWGWVIYDQRGHGESSLSQDANGSPNGFKEFGRPGPGSQWEKMVDDVGSVVRFIGTNMKVDRSQLFLVGASVGANIAFKYMALTQVGRGIVLLSPGLNYVEFKPLDVASKIKGNRVLLVASESDAYAYSSTETLNKSLVGSRFLNQVKPGHGVQMFDEKLLSSLVQWMQKKSIEK